MSWLVPVLVLKMKDHIKTSAWLARQRVLLKTYILNRDGATSIEYALIAALISIVLVITFALVGVNLDGVFQMLATIMAGI